MSESKITFHFDRDRVTIEEVYRRFRVVSSPTIGG